MGLGSSKRASENLGVSKTTLGTWGKTVRENNGEVPVREPSDYVNDGPTLWRIFWILTRWTEMYRKMSEQTMFSISRVVQNCFVSNRSLSASSRLEKIPAAWPCIQTLSET